jgi:hypothetical protein
MGLAGGEASSLKFATKEYVKALAFNVHIRKSLKSEISENGLQK